MVLSSEKASIWDKRRNLFGKEKETILGKRTNNIFQEEKVRQTEIVTISEK